jgi:hypothetical protein
MICNTYEIRARYPIHFDTIKFWMVLEQALLLFSGYELINKGRVIAIEYHELCPRLPT